MTDFFVFIQLKSTSRSSKHSSLSLLKNYDVSMAQSTTDLHHPYRANKLQTRLSFLSSAKYRLLNEKTYNPLRKPSPHKTPRETNSHAAQYYTAAIQNATFKANHIHRSVLYSSHSQILPLPHFHIP